MTVKLSQPEIITVNSEALQTSIRDLLPSQNGFGSELQASNVITPVIDLTATAEGSTLRSDLQTALNFGGATNVDIVTGGSSTISGTGFWRVTVHVHLDPNAGAAGEVTFTATDGATTKTLYAIETYPESDPSFTDEFVDLVFFNTSGVSTTINAVTAAKVTGSFRQIADAAGNFINPVGYPL
jgi:hypothetical protein